MHAFSSKIADLFRDIESDLGTENMSLLALRALQETVKDVKINNIEIFMDQFNHLIDIIECIQPRFAIVIDYLYDIWEIIEEEKKNHLPENIDWCREFIDKRVEKLATEHTNSFKDLIQNGIDCIENNDIILIHSHSNTVLEILSQARKQNKRFHVIIAEQDLEKTYENISFLSSKNISFEVIPAYMLTHIENKVNKVFFGAVTLKSTKEFVMDAGSHAIIAEFFLQNIPCYMFLTSKKFSLWKSIKKNHEVHAIKHTRKHQSKEIIFNRLKFSHDRVQLKYFSNIITEQGIHTPDNVWDFFEMLLNERIQYEQDRVKKYGERPCCIR